jgi:mannose-6-phosphate isomerase-like protein (cupin superfamily)
VRTRILASEATGAAQLCVFEQWSDPWAGAPTHLHPGVEECVSVIAGTCELWIGDARRSLAAGDTVVVPAGVRHSFTNTGTSTLHTLAVFPVPAPPVEYEDDEGVVYEVGGVGSGRALDAHRRVKEPGL